MGLFAQVPQKMSYQAVVRDATGKLVTNHAVGMKISILQGSPTGSTVFQELYNPNPQTNANGLVSIEIGTGIPVTGTFSGIDWSTGPYYLKTETDPAGGTNYTISGTCQLLSVPYALHAGTVASYTETDPVFTSHPANGISGSNITNWSAAYGWGNHASAGYVQSARSLTINGTTLDLSASRTWSVGTVTSVGLSLPDIFSLSGSPVTGSGTIIASLAFQSPGQVFASATGMFGRPAFRSLVAADIPDLDWSKITSGKPITLAGYGITDALNTTASHTANRVFASPNGTAGAPTFRALVTADIPNLDWSKITSGKPTTLAGYGITDAVNTTGNQTIAGNKTFTGTISAGNKTITNVANPINAQDAATKAYVDAQDAAIKAYLDTLITQLSKAGAIVADADGNIYSTVRIGSQVWMGENLKTTKYLDGAAIPNVTGNTIWAGLTSGAYCWYNNDAGNRYGALYNWYAVNTGKLCPEGWHVPTDAEWTILENYLITNGFNYDGTTSGNKIAKSLATATGWNSSTNTGSVGNTDYPAYRNKSGFSGLPGGFRRSSGDFGTIGISGYWWSSTEYSASYAWYGGLTYGSTYVDRGYDSKGYGFSVRCLRDI